MSYVVRFTPENMSASKYDEIIKRLEAAGANAPKGRLFHVAFGDPNALRVSDIWDTKENFEAFGATLMPILQAASVDPGEPDWIEVYNIISGG
jgi:hypothetical protein